MYVLHGIGGEKNGMRWLGAKSRKFEVKSYYDMLVDNMLGISCGGCLGIESSPTKVSIFCVDGNSWVDPHH